MFDLGMSELLVIGVVALVVIGPKDLPELFRSLGKFTAKLRQMSREFSRAMEAAADEAGVKDVAKDLKTMTSPKAMGLEAVKDAASKFEKWDPLKNAAKPMGTPPKSAAAMASATADAATATPEPAPAATKAPLGPETQALFDKQQARKAVALEAAEKLRKVATEPAAVATAVASGPEPTPEPKPKPRGRVRAKAADGADTAKPAE